MKNLEDKCWQKAARMQGTSYVRLNRGLKRIGITITEEMLDALRARAVAEQRSVAGMVRHLVVEGLTQ